MVVRMRGPIDFILETVEQLTWLASALRPSPISEGVASCTPSVIKWRTGGGKEVESTSNNLTGSCEIYFHFNKADANMPELSPRGRC